MKICVRFYGIAYDYTGVREWYPELCDSVDVDYLLKIVVEHFPELKKLVYNNQGEIRDYLSISINNKDIRGLDGYNTQIKDGDRIFIMPPIGGG